MNITHTLKTIASVLLMLSINAAFLIAQSNIKLPEPILARSEAGRFLPKLEELRVLSEKKQWKEFSEVAFKLSYETDIDLKSQRQGRGARLTKEEFAAREWRLYYTCKIGLPTVNEMWNLDYRTRPFNVARNALSDVHRTYYDKSIEIDDKKFRRIRATWMAFLIKNFRTRNKEIEEKVVAVLPKLIQERSIKLLREKRGKYSSCTESDRSYLYFSDISEFQNIADNISGILDFDALMLSLRKESSFIYLLFDSFPDDARTVDEFIKMAGYSNDYESESFWNNALERAARKNGMTTHVQKYLRRSGIDAKRVTTLQKESFEKKKTAEKRQKEKWDKLRVSLEAEERQLWTEIQNDSTKYQKEREAKKQSANPPVSPPTAPTAAPAKP